MYMRFQALVRRSPRVSHSYTYGLPPMLDFVWLRLDPKLPKDLRQFHELDDLCGCFTLVQ